MAIPIPPARRSSELTLPRVVGLQQSGEQLTSPRHEMSGCGHVEVPVGQEPMDGAEIAAHHSDVDVLVGPPGAPKVEIECMAAADPPTERGRGEDLDNRVDPKRLPGAEL